MQIDVDKTKTIITIKCKTPGETKMVLEYIEKGARIAAEEARRSVSGGVAR